MKYRAIFDDEDDLELTPEKSMSTAAKTMTALGVSALVLCLLAALYVSLCREIFYWSSADYWSMARRIAAGELDGRLWSTVYDSVLNSEFNYIPSLISSVFIRLFGETRLVFILSLVICYLFPSYILVYFTAKKIGKAPLVTTLISIFTMPVTIYLTFSGFTEIGGFLICTACFFLYFTKDGREPGLVRMIIIGLLLAALMLWNNWYLFFSVSFITAMIAESIIFRRKWYMRLVPLAVMIAAVSVFFEGFMFQRLLASYGGGEISFRVFDNLKLVTRYLGLIFLAGLAASSVFIGIKYKERRQVFVWLQLAVCYAAFTATRTHGQGHLLMYVPGLTVLLILTVKYIHREQTLIALCVLALIHSVNIFIPREQPKSVSEIRTLAPFPNFSMLPVTRDSAYDILSLKTTLDSVVPEGQYLGVLSYSDILNSEMLKNAEPSLGVEQQRVGYIANTIPYFDVDSGNIEPLCNANYMLVAYPAQLVRDDQNVLSAAVDSFEYWTDIASAYEEMYEYETVIDDVTVKLYRRVRNVTEFEKAAFVNKLRAMINR